MVQKLVYLAKVVRHTTKREEGIVVLKSAAVMEELEQLIRQEFTRLECSFVEEWSGGMSSLPAEASFEAVVRLLWTIQPTLKNSLPSHLLPPSATARFRIASRTAQALQEVGVREAVGFQSLLYGNGKDLMGIFIELLRLLPSNEQYEEDVEEKCFNGGLLARARDLSTAKMWVPEFCRYYELDYDGRFWCPTVKDSELFPLSRGPPSSRWTPLSDSTVDRRSLAASLLSPSASTIDGPSTATATPTAKPALAPKPSHPSGKPTIAPKPSLDAIRNTEEQRELEEALSLLEAIETENNIKKELIVRTETRMYEVDAFLVHYDEKFYRVLADPETARGRIETFLTESESRVHGMESQWEEAQTEAIQELQRLQEQNIGLASTTSLYEKLQKMEEEREELIQTRAHYHSLAQKIGKRVERLDFSDAINRPSYVKKIMEITNALKKQREEMSRVGRETEMVLKDIKWAEQAINRTFDLIENTFYKRVDRSPKDERLYRSFVNMHNQCQLIIRCVEGTGQKKSKIERLYQELEKRGGSAMDEKMGLMEADQAAVMTENQELVEEIRAELEGGYEEIALALKRLLEE